jgi:uncharacterized protein (TIGR02186 family)
MSRLGLWFCLVLFLGLGLARPAAAQALVVDLTDHQIAITTGFQGAHIVLFGATDGGSGDIVVVVRGPTREVTVRHKSRIAGIWLNTESVTFGDAPGYYAVFGTRPVEQILPYDQRKLEGIGIDALDIVPLDQVEADEAATYRGAFVHDMQRRNLYGMQAGQVSFLGGRLFRATLVLPASVPVGSYQVEALLVRGGVIVAAETTSLVVFKAGLEAEINDYANEHALLYGIFAVIASAMVGWGATLIARGS